jgi:hypothetical protein
MTKKKTSDKDVVGKDYTSSFNFSDSSTNNSQFYLINFIPKINKKIVKIITSTLCQLINDNFSNKIHNKNNNIKIFYNKFIPEIQLSEYVLKIIELTKCEFNTLIYSLILIDKLYFKGFIINEYNIYKLFYISIIISIKMNQDIIYDNKYYAKILGVEPKELLILETNFLTLLNFNIYISNDSFQYYLDSLELY